MTPDHKKEKNFTNSELGALLRLFSAMGITMAASVTGFFLLGLHVDSLFREHEMNSRGIPVAIGVLTGVLVGFYWCYLRITRHMAEFGVGPADSDAAGDGDDPEHGDRDNPQHNACKRE